MAEFRVYYIKLLHANHQRNCSGMVCDDQPKAIILWMCDYAKKVFSIYNSEHPERMKRNYCQIFVSERKHKTVKLSANNFTIDY